MPNNDIHLSGSSRKKYGPKSTLAQILATLALGFLSIEVGMKLSISTIVIKDLFQSSNINFSITQAEAAWYASSLFISQPFGNFVSGIFQERIGKKLCMILTNIPGVIGWILLYYAQSATILCVSIIIMGFNVGFNFGPTYSYIGEMTEPRLRGIMASLLSMAVMTGSLLTFALGSMLHWRTVALVNACCPIICICLIAAIPESPIWLMAKGKNDEAEKAICWLRGWVEPETVKHEFLELIRYNERSKTQVDADSEGGLLKKLAYFKDPSVYRPFKLLMIYFFVAFIVCIIPGRPYIGKILTEVGVPTNQGLYLIIFAALQGIGSVVLMVVVNRLGKRFLTLLTLSINSIMLLLFGVYTLVLKNNFVSSTPWIPLTILCIIYFSGSCGVLSIPYLLTSEIFPNNCRGIATGVCGGLSNIIIFIITAMYLFVENVLTLEYTMILYGLVGIFGLIYFYLYLPETENQTLLEIEEHFT